MTKTTNNGADAATEIDREAVLATYSERDVAIFLAVESGASQEAVGATHGITRQRVCEIDSAIRRKLGVWVNRRLYKETDRDIDIIRRRSDGETLREIAADYGISLQRVCGICDPGFRMRQARERREQRRERARRRAPKRPMTTIEPVPDFYAEAIALFDALSGAGLPSTESHE